MARSRAMREAASGKPGKDIAGRVMVGAVEAKWKVKAAPLLRQYEYQGFPALDAYSIVVKAISDLLEDVNGNFRVMLTTAELDKLRQLESLADDVLRDSEVPVDIRIDLTIDYSRFIDLRNRTLAHAAAGTTPLSLYPL